MNSCATKPQGLHDSSWAYYAGGTHATRPLGLARAMNDLTSAAHDRAYDGVLAVRCWRNLDNNETGTATNLTLRDRALARARPGEAARHGLIVRQRVTELGGSGGTSSRRVGAFLTTLGPLLDDREARARGSSEADVIASELSAASPSGSMSNAPLIPSTRFSRVPEMGFRVKARQVQREIGPSVSAHSAKSHATLRSACRPSLHRARKNRR